MNVCIFVYAYNFINSVNSVLNRMKVEHVFSSAS